MTSAAVAFPPRNPYRSARITRTPDPAAPSAAPRPDGPPPTTRTSVSAATWARRGGRSIRVVCSGRRRAGIAALRHALPGAQRLEKLAEDPVGSPGSFLQGRDFLLEILDDLLARIPGSIQERAEL